MQIDGVMSIVVRSAEMRCPARGVVGGRFARTICARKFCRGCRRFATFIKFLESSAGATNLPSMRGAFCCATVAHPPDSGFLEQSMAAIERRASGVWRGDLKGGSGAITVTSGVLQETPFTYATRFENAKGTNPEELIAAAHAACFSMAFANYLTTQGHTPERISTRATISLENGVIGKMRLETEGQVPGVDAAEFKRLAVEAEKKCPVSNLLRVGLAISLDASLAAK